jgi:hypothetical protein
VQQLSYKLLATSGKTSIPSIAIVQEAAPSKPNVCTDGSLPFPGTSLAFATFGTWEWDRDIAQIQPEELTFCRPVQVTNPKRNGGIMLAGTLQGVYSSSTRAELGGVISAMAKPIGLHIALDNRGVVDRANSIIDGTSYSRKPFALRDDGDLWQAFTDAVQMQGRESIRISWTKGHASWQHVIANATNDLAIANGQADMAADMAAEACEKGSEAEVLQFHALKQVEYEKLLRRLQSFAARLLAHDKELRQEAGFQAQGKKALPVLIEAPPLPSRADFTEGEGLNLLPLPPNLEAQQALLHLFLNGLRWRLEARTKPTTWLELFAIFRLLGGVKGERTPMA